MKNFIILIIIVAIAAGLWFVSQNKSPSAPPTAEKAATANTETKPSSPAPTPEPTSTPEPRPTPSPIPTPSKEPAPGTKDSNRETIEPAAPGPSLASPNETKSTESKPLTLNAEVIAGEKTKLYEFNQKDYETAAASEKLVVLYYYANWCPICTKEFADAKSVFNELENADVVGFRVNFNDSDTEDAEKELAQKYGVAYQHTKVFVRNGERILKSPEGWSRERYVKEINAAL